MRIGDEVYIHGYIDEIRKDIVIIRNNGGYFGTMPSEIKAIAQEPKAEGDCISREAVICAFWKLDVEMTPNAIDAILDMVNNLPSITPQEPKVGHWIVKDGKEKGYDIGGVKTWYVQGMCNRCGFIKTAIEGHTSQYKYCPSCGARMESEGSR